MTLSESGTLTFSSGFLPGSLTIFALGMAAEGSKALKSLEPSAGSFFAKRSLRNASVRSLLMRQIASLHSRT